LSSAPEEGAAPGDDGEAGHVPPLKKLEGGAAARREVRHLIGHAERLELSHRAMTRDVFADGAVVAARFLGRSGREARREIEAETGRRFADDIETNLLAALLRRRANCKSAAAARQVCPTARRADF